VGPRAYWKGYLKLSLVSCPIALYPASSEREKISFHQLNKATGNRIKYQKVDAATGDVVEGDDIIKGYEVGKGEYIELQPEELEAIALESKRTIEIEQFVPRSEIDELYLRDPYYIVPDGEVGQQAFAVMREAIRKEGMVALGKIVFTSREHIISLEPRGKGLMGMTLRYPYEVRKEKDYFDDIADEKVPKDMLDLAAHIVDTGIIKSVLGFRQFSLRGLEKVRGEWSLVTTAWNMKRMFVLNPADVRLQRRLSRRWRSRPPLHMFSWAFPGGDPEGSPYRRFPRTGARRLPGSRVGAYT
jgi:Ku protein